MDIFTGLFKEFGWFIWGLVAIGVLWFVTGGANNAASYRPYIEPAAPLSTGQTYGETYIPSPDKPTSKIDINVDIVADAEEAAKAVKDVLTPSKAADQVRATSLLSKSFLFDGIAGVETEDAQKEYVRIIASEHNKGAPVLSGLVLTGSGKDVRRVLPKALNLPILGNVYEPTDVFVPPSGRVLISSGKSPIGASFRVNMCTGYLSQFQTFTPDLRHDCPEPIKELENYGPYEESSCRTFISNIPRCQTYSGSLPNNISLSCKNFVNARLNYNGCVARHKDEPNFYANEWRLFLESGTELWKSKQELIRLLDAKDLTIDVLTY
jgi:hypothetical protein